MGKGTKREEKQPEFTPAFIEVDSHSGKYDKEQECVAEYPSLAEVISEDDIPYRLVDDVR